MCERGTNKEKNINYISPYGYLKCISEVICICFPLLVIFNTLFIELNIFTNIISVLAPLSILIGGYFILIEAEKFNDIREKNPLAVMTKTYILEKNEDEYYADIEWIQNDDDIVRKIIVQINGEKWVSDDIILNFSENDGMKVEVIYGFAGVKALNIYCPKSMINEHSEISPLRISRMLEGISVDDLSRRTKIPLEKILRYDSGEESIEENNEISLLAAVLDCEPEELR